MSSNTDTQKKSTIDFKPAEGKELVRQNATTDPQTKRQVSPGTRLQWIREREEANHQPNFCEQVLDVVLCTIL